MPYYKESLEFFMHLHWQAVQNSWHIFLGRLIKSFVFVGSLVATPHSSARKAHKDRMMFSSRHTNELEEWIDDYTKELPPLENFILPGGSSMKILYLLMCRKLLQYIPIGHFFISSSLDYALKFISHQKLLNLRKSFHSGPFN